MATRWRPLISEELHFSSFSLILFFFFFHSLFHILSPSNVVFPFYSRSCIFSIEKENFSRKYDPAKDSRTEETPRTNVSCSAHIRSCFPRSPVTRGQTMVHAMYRRAHRVYRCAVTPHDARSVVPKNNADV